MLAVGLVAQRSPSLILAIIATAAVAFVSWGLVRRRLTGRETTVLLEHFAVTLSAVTGLLVALGAEVLPGLDLLVLGLSVFLVLGRVGCLVGGCCYGVPSSWGVRYPSECIPPDSARRFPVQGIEVFAWLGLSAWAAWAILALPPGVATGGVLLLYGALRIPLESLRGDLCSSRLGLSEGRWLGALAVGAGLWLLDGRAGLGPAAVAFLLASVLLFTRRWWHQAPDGSSATRLTAFETAGRRLASGGLSEEVQCVEVGGTSVCVSRQGDGASALTTVSVRFSTRTPSRAEVAVVLDHVLRGLGRPGEDPEIVEGRDGVFLALASGALSTPARDVADRR